MRLEHLHLVDLAHYKHSILFLLLFNNMLNIAVVFHSIATLCVFWYYLAIFYRSLSKLNVMFFLTSYLLLPFLYPAVFPLLVR